MVAQRVLLQPEHEPSAEICKKVIYVVNKESNATYSNNESLFVVITSKGENTKCHELPVQPLFRAKTTWEMLQL
jgi:hypothetical protein